MTSNADKIATLINQISLTERKILNDTLTKEENITTQQAMILQFIGKNPGLIQTDIVKQTHRRPATISVALKKLEADGLITRQIQSDNTRNKKLALTPKGQTIVERFTEARATASKKLVAPLSVTQQEQLIELLKAIILN